MPTVRPPRAARLLFALTLLVTSLFGRVATPARAAPSCTTSGTTVTCTFSYTGAADTWTVPPDVTSATFDLYGAGATNYHAGVKADACAPRSP